MEPGKTADVAVYGFSTVLLTVAHPQIIMSATVSPKRINRDRTSVSLSGSTVHNGHCGSGSGAAAHRLDSNALQDGIETGAERRICIIQQYLHPQRTPTWTWLTLRAI